MEELYDNLIDVTGVKLTPSSNGELCAGSGKEKYECCCDECDYYLLCFPYSVSNEGKAE